MARLPLSSRTTRSRFPRPRGDGPVEEFATWGPLVVPPPTRGWPAAPERRGHRAAGSPAHAGMARLRSGVRGGEVRFPRPRGDGPYRFWPDTGDGRVPPPTRGWPQSPDRWGGHLQGSPAHAGMAPASAPSCAGTSRFPRPRGDGPVTMGALSLQGQVPPPTRGWPCCGRCLRASGLGSPAHAGMARARASGTRPGARFPRPRGDGPDDGTARRARPGVPPPTRGWPAVAEGHEVGVGGSPAHAGMAPLPQWQALAPRRFPRPRGDGPMVPATAWMVASVPPPTRGWPPVIRPREVAHDGSPAHAGMARWATRPAPAPSRFPRPRGDGPWSTPDTPTTAWVPPPTRGWPRRPHRRSNPR